MDLLSRASTSDLFRRARRVVLLAALAGALIPATVVVAASIEGTDGPNKIVGTPSADMIDAFGGDDVVLGLAGADFIDGGADDDTLGGDGVCPPGTANALYCQRGGNGDDTILAGSGNDSAYGDGGEDAMAGESGSDQLEGNDGRDRIVGGSGADRLDGGAGDDRIWGDDNKDRVVGQDGDDKLNGGDERDVIVGGPGDDKVKARDKERDRINCGSGEDRAVVDEVDRVKDCETLKRK